MILAGWLRPSIPSLPHGVCFSTTMPKSMSSCVAFATLAICCAALQAQQSAQPRAADGRTVSPAAKPEETELWKPVPRVVTPGAECGAPPSDAIILFDGKDLDQWVSSKDKSPAKWIVASGVVTVNKAAGDIETKRKFGNYQLHIEWRVPEDVTGSSQARGNSGVFLAATGPPDDGYELQVLDSYKNQTYVNGMAGSLYKQSIPFVNPTRPPGAWQIYDVVWTAPVFRADGSLKSPAYATVFFNGVLVDNHFELKGVTRYIGQPYYKEHGAAPIRLQAHGDPSPPISFRNIWVRELD